MTDNNNNSISNNRPTNLVEFEMMEVKHRFGLDKYPDISTEQLVLAARDIIYSMKNHGANYVALGALEDVVVMNQKRVSQSSNYASYGRSKYHIAGTGGSRSTGMTIGDVIFVSQGRPFITFSQVQDPRN